MNATTKETRRESYAAILPKVNKRSALILDTLGDREMTVSEIAEELVRAGILPCFNRNYVAPRLTEIKAQLPTISLLTAYWKGRISLAFFKGYLQPSMLTPLTTGSTAIKETYL